MFKITLLLIFSLVIFIIILIKKSKIIENFSGLRVIQEIDRKRATKFAIKKLCEKGGYKWFQGPDEFVYDCKHTKQTCQGESVFPTPQTENAVPKYYEWRDKNSPVYKEYSKLNQELDVSNAISASLGESSKYTNVLDEDGICIIGNEPFRQFCEDETLRYDINDGKCYTTKPYCNQKLLAFCDNDCFEPPFSNVLSKVFGNTLGRTLGAATGVDVAVIAACK